jgi:hypothetical protein
MFTIHAQVSTKTGCRHLVKRQIDRVNISVLVPKEKCPVSLAEPFAVTPSSQNDRSSLGLCNNAYSVDII